MTGFEKDILSCIEVLRSGGVILYPTDTVWGLGCDATNQDAVARVYEIKQRPLHSSMLVLVTEEQDVLNHVAAPDLAVFDHLKSCSNPTTVVYEGAIGFADNLVAEDGSIAIRICQDPFCRHLIKRFGKPIVSTSANLHTHTTPGNFSEMDPSILKQVDYVVAHRQQDQSNAVSSSLIRWVNGHPLILRP